MSKKISEKKEQLLQDLISDLWENNFEYKDYIKDLLYEALRTRSIKELKEILYGYE